MAALHNDIFLRALLKQPVDYTPVWLMRQAGRYLPEYRATRAKAGSFLALCQNPELATEVTLQPLERFALDAAILFSDILTVPDAMGLGLHFVEGEGPKFTHPLQHEQDVARLEVPDMSRLRYVFDAVSSIRQALQGCVPLIGFSGSPFTLACYMVEGGSSRDFRLLKTILYQRPQLLHRILNINAQTVTAYLNEQIASGAQAVQIFDTWGGILSDAAFQEFDLLYLQQVVSGLQREADGRRVPVIVFTKGGGQWLEQLAALDVDALGVDWTVNLHQARHQVGQRVALQGNLDPLALFGQPENIECEIKRLLAAYGAGSGHVFNLGHGINQFTDAEMVKFAVEAVHRLSVGYHQN
ncbi:uroporphyrinogen decarboxylase [Snodgrassella communis]|uniref:Uroporphyrinogen decarboxylase n=1 Tax=Snodgrassella communis TaxID=2946699 RepID=A0A066TND6_9NEIS|nr:uroporphyrinogen decarboxylase [Snodgrassella communis]KDN13568.1 Uroporphyrinogen III decarboxylase [Snodgrassella communis]KDN15858.1 Uroporphyrinogen III decarboxylase [Snodgrassella communis]PIT12036.1 uroporphyrinogen decarboxylase [Snodgrassella communis]PIT29021.1 uroporphyrinogen decarboxylase [Snodgrassella communis]PIT29918.1 uroporphyrinogen decarboxylase [Snodgrassella communis]